MLTVAAHPIQSRRFGRFARAPCLNLLCLNRRTTRLRSKNFYSSQSSARRRSLHPRSRSILGRETFVHEKRFRKMANFSSTVVRTLAKFLWTRGKSPCPSIRDNDVFWFV